VATIFSVSFVRLPNSTRPDADNVWATAGTVEMTQARLPIHTQTLAMKALNPCTGFLALDGMILPLQ
jgi:hypothetical protein